MGDLSIKLKVIQPEKVKKKEGFMLYCSKCGAYMEGNVSHALSVDDAYIDELNRSAFCPVCENKLEAVDGYFLPKVTGFSYSEQYIRDTLFPGSEKHIYNIRREYNENWFKLLEERREIVEHDKAKKMVEAFFASCDSPVPCNGINSLIKENPVNLKKYILHLIEAENNIYSIGRYLDELYYQRMQYNRDIVWSGYEPAIKVKSQLEKLCSRYQNAVSMLNKAEEYRPEISVKKPRKPKEPTLAQPGLFNKKKAKEENDALIAQYHADLEAYRKKVQECNDEEERLMEKKRAEYLSEWQGKADAAKIALESAERDADRKIKELEERPAPAKAIKEVLDEEIREAEELLKKTFAARNEMYAYDIIFEKYRNTVALSSFYEYLMAGRCTSLEGADGAYNLYENEIRMNRVINQLDTVISSLEEIKQNQYMMYQELRNINTSLQRLNSTMDKALTSIQGIEANSTSMNEYMEHISKNSDVIAHNTAVTAYYSKVNTELTNALGYMVAFK